MTSHHVSHPNIGIYSYLSEGYTFTSYKELPVTLKLPGAGVLGCISMVLLMKVLWVASLLLLLLHLHPAWWYCGWEAGSQRLKACQLHQWHQALCGQRLVHQKVHSCTKGKLGDNCRTSDQQHYREAKGRNTDTVCRLMVDSVSVLPVIPGLEGLEEGLAPSSSSSAPLERGPSINMSPSSISSHTPPIWRKWSSPPSDESKNKIMPLVQSSIQHLNVYLQTLTHYSVCTLNYRNIFSQRYAERVKTR